mgnify:CR=1 FL=1
MTTNDQPRVIALTLAVTALTRAAIDASEVLSTATTYLDFLTGPSTGVAETTAPAPQPELPAKRGPGRPPKAERAAPAVKTAPAAKPYSEPAPESEEAIVESAVQAAAAPVIDRAAVSAVVAEMLAANKRNEAIALLKDFGASSVSGVAEKDYSAFVEKANAIVGSGDLTA